MREREREKRRERKRGRREEREKGREKRERETKGCAKREKKEWGGGGGEDVKLDYQRTWQKCSARPLERCSSPW